MAFELYVSLIGATIVFTQGTIFAPIRSIWRQFFGCPLCVGVWVGGSWTLFERGLVGWKSVLDALLIGAAVGLLSYLTALVLNVLDASAAALDRAHPPPVDLVGPKIEAGKN